VGRSGGGAAERGQDGAGGVRGRSLRETLRLGIEIGACSEGEGGGGGGTSERGGGENRGGAERRGPGERGQDGAVLGCWGGRASERASGRAGGGLGEQSRTAGRARKGSGMSGAQMRST
jgi:hypothetical protein